MKRKQSLPLPPQQTYIPATSDAPPVFEQSKRSLPFIARDRPDLVCGVARRVGSTGNSRSDLAIYRLKLKVSFASLTTATLPGFFIIENGVFVVYDEWSSRQAK